MGRAKGREGSHEMRKVGKVGKGKAEGREKGKHVESERKGGETDGKGGKEKGGRERMGRAMGRKGDENYNNNNNKEDF